MSAALVAIVVVESLIIVGYTAYRFYDYYQDSEKLEQMQAERDARAMYGPRQGYPPNQGPMQQGPGAPPGQQGFFPQQGQRTATLYYANP